MADLPTAIVPGLFVGPRPRTYRGYDLAVCCELEVFPAVAEGFKGTTLHVPMRDLRNWHPRPFASESAAALAANYVRADRAVLIHCKAGVNRSGVIAALTLIALGHTPAKALALLREKRPGMLRNQYFEAFTLGQRCGCHA